MYLYDWHADKSQAQIMISMTRFRRSGQTSSIQCLEEGVDAGEGMNKLGKATNLKVTLQMEEHALQLNQRTI
jgi:hypothetical protein